MYEIVEIHEEDESVFQILAIPIPEGELRYGPESLHRKHSHVIDDMFHHVQLWVDYSVSKPVKSSIILSHIVRVSV